MKKPLNIFKKYYFFIIPLLIFILLAAWYLLINNPDNDINVITDEIKSKEDSIYKSQLPGKVSNEIDSIFFQFGIRDLWITTVYSDDKQKIADKKILSELKSKWFGKKVIIPSDVNSIEINFELTSYARNKGLEIIVNEDIIKKDIDVIIYNGKDTLHKEPLVRILVRHDTKISRDIKYFSIVLAGSDDMNEDDLSRLLKNEYDLSYLINYDLDNFDLINKINHEKRDVILEVAAGKADNYKADFRIGQSERELRQKVKGIMYDYRNTRNVMITNNDNIDIFNTVYEPVKAEFERNNISIIPLSGVYNMLGKNSNEILGLLLEKTFGVIIIDPGYNELQQVRENMNILKKRGYKFMSYSDYIIYDKSFKEKMKRSQEEDRIKKEVKHVKKQKQSDTKKQTTTKQTITKKNAKKK